MDTTDEKQFIDFTQFEALNMQQKLALANQLHEQLNLDDARVIYEKIILSDSNNLEALDHYTDILEETGDTEKLELILSNFLIQKNQNIIMSYEQSYKLFFKYAQTQNGEKSIEYLNYGKQLLEQLIQKQQGEPPKWMLKDIADAYSAIAEVYQTDLLSLKSSEKLCLQNINLAFQYDQTNLDAFLQLANFHLNKEDEEAAKQDLKIICEKINLNQEQEVLEEDFLLQVGKLLVELEDYKASEQIMRKAIDMNEKNPETLYMLAFSLWKQSKFTEAFKLCDGINNIPSIKDDEVYMINYIFKKYKEVFTATQELITQLLKENVSTEQFNNESHQNENDDDWMDLE